MKQLLVLAITIGLLVGCSDSEKSKKSTTYPELSLNQEVRVVSGFYKGQYGKIMGWEPCRDRDSLDNTVCYNVKTETETYSVNQRDIRI